MMETAFERVQSLKYLFYVGYHWPLKPDCVVVYCVSLLPQECTVQAGRTKGSQNPWFECASFFVHSTGMTEQAKPMMATSEGDSRCPIERRSKRHSVDDFKGHHSSIVWAVQDPMFLNIITSKHGNIHLQKHCRYVVQKHHRSYIQFYQRQKHLILYHTVVILVS